MTECSGANSCPTIKELPDGSFLVIGSRMDGGGIGARSVASSFYLKVADHENAVVVPRSVMISALYEHARSMASE